MARSRKLLRRYPHNAERLYYRLLRTAIEQWFAELKEVLFQHPAIRKDELFDNIFDQQQGRWADFAESVKNRMNDVSGQVSDTVHRTFAEQAQQVQNDLGVDLSRGSVLPFGENQSAVNAFTRENTLLIKDIGDKAARDIEIAVQDVVSRGGSTKELQKIIQENLDSTKKRAALIARDQIGKLNGQLTRIQHEAAGIESYEWSTSADSRVRSEHIKREGKVFSYKKPPPDGNPGQPIRCRCVALPVFEDVAVEEAETFPVQPEAEKPKASSGSGSVPLKPPKKARLGDNPSKKAKKPGGNNSKPPSINPDETKKYSESSQSDQYMIHYHQQQMKLPVDDRRELVIAKNRAGNVLDMALGKSRNQAMSQKGYATVSLPPGVDSSDVVTIHNHILSNASFSGMDIAAGHKADLGPIQVIAFHNGTWFRFHLEPRNKWPSAKSLAHDFDKEVRLKFGDLLSLEIELSEAHFKARHLTVVDFAARYELIYMVREITEVPDG